MKFDFFSPKDISTSILNLKVNNNNGTKKNKKKIRKLDVLNSYLKRPVEVLIRGNKGDI